MIDEKISWRPAERRLYFRDFSLGKEFHIDSYFVKKAKFLTRSDTLGIKLVWRHFCVSADALPLNKVWEGSHTANDASADSQRG